MSKCIACAQPMKVGDAYYPDESGGVVHADCIGPERESYTYDGEQHPKYPDDHYEHHLRGRFIPLHDGGFAEADADWSEGHNKWQQGLHESYGAGEKWAPIEEEHKGLRYTDYAGPRPSPDDYMPDWPDAERTHFMMYEDTSEGTPISPAFATPEELARWLADNGARAFADMTATYDEWLSMIGRRSAISMVIGGGVMKSGVAAGT